MDFTKEVIVEAVQKFIKMDSGNRSFSDDRKRKRVDTAGET